MLTIIVVMHGPRVGVFRITLTRMLTHKNHMVKVIAKKRRIVALVNNVASIRLNELNVVIKGFRISPLIFVVIKLFGIILKWFINAVTLHTKIPVNKSVSNV